MTDLDALLKELDTQFRTGSNYTVRRIGGQAAAAIREQAKEIARLATMADALLAHCDKENGECSVCGTIVCPHKDGMHFHHDGCPSCAEDEQ